MDELQKRVLEHVDEKALIELLKDMIAIRSDAGKEKKLAEFLVKRLTEMGFTAELQEVPGFEGRPNVIGILEGDKDYRSLMFNGHMDTDLTSPYWTRDPYKPVIIDGWLIGKGAHNMKSGDAAMIMAAFAIKEAGVKPKGDIIITQVMGETDTLGVGTIEVLKRYKADAGICGEPTWGDNHIITAHAGVVQLQVIAEGRIAHHTAIDQQLNAIEKMCKIIAKFDKSMLTYEESELIKGLPQIIIGQIEGGVAPLFTAPTCTITVDIRLAPGMTVEGVKRDVENLIERLREEDPELKATVELFLPPKLYPRPALIVSEDEAIVQSLRKAYKDFVGGEPVIGGTAPTAYFVTDAYWMTEAGIPTPLYGARGGHFAGQHDERNRVEDIVTTCKVMTLAALDFITKKRGSGVS